MQRNQRDALGPLLQRILVGNERRLFNKAIERVKRLKLKEAPRNAAQLQQVRPALLPLHPLRRKMRAEARLAINRVEQLREMDQRQS